MTAHHHARSCAVVKSHRRDSTIRTTGPIAAPFDVDDACPNIDWRESAARASEHPWMPACPSCGCEADRVPPHHSPRCSA